jgi:hypothetical protein
MNTFFVTEEIASQMELDETSILDFELVVLRQCSNNTSWTF